MSNFYNNPYRQEQAAYGNSYQYAPQNNVEWTQPLTTEEARSLRTTAPAFDVLNVSKEEMIKSHCAHRDPVRKELTLQEMGDGTFRCALCGEEFNLVDISEEEAEKYVNGIIDMLQTTKTLYVDLPPATIDAYFQMIPFLKKLPKLYRMAHDTFSRATGTSSVRSAYMTRNPWLTMGQAVGGVFNGMPQYGAPYDPNYGYNQYQNPQVYEPQAPGQNPFMQSQAREAEQVPFNPTYSQQGGYNAPVQNQATPANSNNGNNNTGAVTTNKQFEV